MSIPADVPRKSKEIPPEVGKILESIEVLLTSLKGKLYESADAPNEGLENGIFRFSGKDKGNPGSRQPLASNRAQSPPLPDPRLVKAIIQSRLKRGAMFGGGLFADPVWDMILDLVLAQSEYRRVSVSSLCIASGVPSTTALRWITQLVERGIFERTDDICDKRRAFVTLSDKAMREVARHFADVEAAGI